MKKEGGPEKALRFLIRLVELYLSHRVSRTGAAFAYFMTLSALPLMILVNALLARVGPSPALEGLAEGLLPAGVAEFLREASAPLSAGGSPALLWAALTAAVSSCAGAVRLVMRAAEEFYDRRGGGARGYLRSFALSVCFLLCVYAGIAAVLTGGWFLARLDALFGVGALVSSWRWLRFALLFGIVFFLLLGLYRAVLPRGALPSPVLPGALLGAAAFSAASALFSWFIGLSARYSLLYGSLASVAILMLWLYLVGTVVVMGAAVNRLCGGGPPEQGPGSGSGRPARVDQNFHS